MATTRYENLSQVVLYFRHGGAEQTFSADSMEETDKHIIIEWAQPDHETEDGTIAKFEIEHLTGWWILKKKVPAGD